MAAATHLIGIVNDSLYIMFIPVIFHNSNLMAFDKGY